MKTLTCIPYTLEKSTHGILNKIYFCIFFYIVKKTFNGCLWPLDPYSLTLIPPSLDLALMQHGAPARQGTTRAVDEKSETAKIKALSCY